jgi:hypothetical protein
MRAWPCAAAWARRPNVWVLTRGAPWRAEGGTGAPSACSTLLGGTFATMASGRDRGRVSHADRVPRTTYSDHFPGIGHTVRLGIYRFRHT